LSLTLAGFVTVRRGHHRQFGTLQCALRVLVALPLLFSGIALHFFRTAEVASIIPPQFPAHIALVLLTGILEIAGAVGLLIRRFQHNAALGIALLLIAVFPANIHAAGKVVGGVQMPGVAVRTIMQMVYMLLVLVSSYGLPVLPQKSAS
jgi:uncharacterized membrane protein